MRPKWVRTQFRPGFRYPKAGAVLSELQAAGHEQGELDLFAGIEATGHRQRIRVTGSWLHWIP